MKVALDNQKTEAIRANLPLTRQLGSWLLNSYERLVDWLSTKDRGEKLVLFLLIAGIPTLMFYNLEINPRPWHDEGSSLILARTLAEDGVYAMRNSDGYQTFGPVQSVGPTVIVPISLIFRVFGVGLLQGRIVVVIYTLTALLLFYLIGRQLFDRWTTILGLIFLLAAPAVRILIYGRQVLGEVPGLTFFLAGFLMLDRSLQKHKTIWTILAGLLFGAAIVTKSQYLLMIPASLVCLAILDLIYFRQGAWKTLTIIIVLVLACGIAWQVWQMQYFGMDVYQNDLAKLRQLATVTTGFHPPTAIGGVRSMLGSDSGHFYLFWGFPALIYLFLSSARHNLKGLLLAFLVIFTSFWLLYFMFWTISWHRYGLPAMVLIALFISKLYSDLARASWTSLHRIMRSWLAGDILPLNSIITAGSVVGLLSYGLWTGYNLQQHIRLYVLDQRGDSGADLFTPPQLQNPRLIAEYLEQNIPPGAIIETWERELGILTDLTYHYPDQSMLAYTHKATYLGGESGYQLGEEYLLRVRPDYVVIGWYSRFGPVYDTNYLLKNSELIWSIGSAGFQYEVYKMLRYGPN